MILTCIISSIKKVQGKAFNFAIIESIDVKNFKKPYLTYIPLTIVFMTYYDVNNIEHHQFKVLSTASMLQNVDEINSLCIHSSFSVSCDTSITFYVN